MSWYVRQRAADRIAELATAGLGLPAFWREAADAISRVVPNYLGPCWFTLDPASLLVTSHYQEGLPEIPHDWLAAEYYEDDYNKMADVARSEQGIATLHEATGGDPRRSPRYEQAIVAYGGEQEMIAALRTATGQVWGSLGLYREPDRPMFDDDDSTFIRSVSASLAEGARRGLLLGEATDPEAPDAPGLIVLADDWTIDSATPSVERWMSELPGGDWEAGRLPPAVLAVAGLTRRGADGTDSPTDGRFARIMSRTGRWLVLHGVTLVSDDARRVAVIIEPAHPARITPLLMAAYGLTEREQDVTRCVLHGMSTSQIAEHLHITANTVQDHLKHVFAKTGVNSRRDLVGTVFFTHYEPRVRDNEHRVGTGRAMRGGPAIPRT